MCITPLRPPHVPHTATYVTVTQVINRPTIAGGYDQIPEILNRLELVDRPDQVSLGAFFQSATGHIDVFFP